MKRSIGSLLLLGCILCGPTSSQEERSATHVYEAYYRIPYADLDAWEQSYREHSVPVLEALQEEGVIEGWTHSRHHTGGHYNIRFAFRSYDWASIETFWREYLARLEDAAPENQRTALERMIVEHRDEVWNLGETNLPEGLEANYMYASKFSVNFADLEEWNSMWSGLMAGFIEQAAEDGIRVGWVRLDHNTGGPHNSKHLFLFEDWDSIDDFIFGRVLGTLSTEQPETWRRLNELFDMHDDAIWVPTAAEETAQ